MPCPETNPLQLLGLEDGDLPEPNSSIPKSMASNVPVFDTILSSSYSYKNKVIITSEETYQGDFSAIGFVGKLGVLSDPTRRHCRLHTAFVFCFSPILCSSSLFVFIRRGMSDTFDK